MPSAITSNNFQTTQPLSPTAGQGVLPSEQQYLGYGAVAGMPPALAQMALPTFQDNMMSANAVLMQSQMMLQNLNIGPEQTIWGGMLPSMMEKMGIEPPAGLSVEMQQQMHQIQGMISQVQNIQMQMPPSYLRDYTMGQGLNYLQGMHDFWNPQSIL